MSRRGLVALAVSLGAHLGAVAVLARGQVEPSTREEAEAPPDPVAGWVRVDVLAPGAVGVAADAERVPGVAGDTVDAERATRAAGSPPDPDPAPDEPPSPAQSAPAPRAPSLAAEEVPGPGVDAPSSSHRRARGGAAPAATGSLPGEVGEPPASGDVAPGQVTSTGPTGQGGGPSGGRTGAHRSPTADFRAAIHGRLSRAAARCYPQAARRFQLRGEVRVSFCVGPGGALRRAERRTSSGSRLLDEAALKCVLPEAAPFPGPEDCYVVPVLFGAGS